MATMTLVYRAGVASGSSPESYRRAATNLGRMISTQVITIGTTEVAVPDHTQFIEIIPDADDGDGYYWISPAEDEDGVDATHHRPIKSGDQSIVEEWRNNYEFQHAESLS